MTWSIIFEKMKNFWFSCNKNGLTSQGMFELLRMKSPDHVQRIKYAQLCHTMFRSFHICIWSRFVALQKKLFLKWEPLRPRKKLFLECHQASYDKFVHISWVVYDQGFLFVVIRTSLGLLIRFYCKKIRNSSFFP